MTTADFERNGRKQLLDHVDVGIFVLDRDCRVQAWNWFMATHSGVPARKIVGQNLFDYFPDLPREWLVRKLESVIRLKGQAFSSWEHRPYLFRFAHNRPITGGIDFMRQNLTLIPVKDARDEVVEVAITLHDVTDVSLGQTRLNEANQRLEILSQRDGLTGLYNRRYWQERLEEEFGRAQRYGAVFSLVLFDLDHFKQINDRYGHPGGDEVLRAVARRLPPLLRTTDLAGRYGGEEFAVLLTNTMQAGALVVAERIREAMRSEEVQFSDHEISFTASIGVVQFDPECSSASELIARADRALYAAKRGGRDLVCCHGDPGVGNAVLKPAG
ncbi:MAG: diguanylate cyclase [Porticoccaceae bacterium]|nr:MAG: diguanylate cyclase [Porticoccaceae bacterium]